MRAIGPAPGFPEANGRAAESFLAVAGRLDGFAGDGAWPIRMVAGWSFSAGPFGGKRERMRESADGGYGRDGAAARREAGGRTDDDAGRGDAAFFRG